MCLAFTNFFCSAGELKPAEIDKVLDVIAKPEDYKVIARNILTPLVAAMLALSFNFALLFIYSAHPPAVIRFLLTTWRPQIPRYFLNRQRDWKEGNSLQVPPTHINRTTALTPLLKFQRVL